MSTEIIIMLCVDMADFNLSDLLVQFVDFSKSIVILVETVSYTILFQVVFKGPHDSYITMVISL